MKLTKSKLKEMIREELKLTEAFDLKKLEDAIKMFQKKIKKQGRVTNARDEEHLEKLIKVYKEMGGKKIKEGKLDETVPMGRHDKVKFRKFMDMALKHAGTNPDEIAKSLFRLGVPNKFVKKMGDVLANQVKGMA